MMECQLSMCYVSEKFYEFLCNSRFLAIVSCNVSCGNRNHNYRMLLWKIFYINYFYWFFFSIKYSDCASPRSPFFYETINLVRDLVLFHYYQLARNIYVLVDIQTTAHAGADSLSLRLDSPLRSARSWLIVGANWLTTAHGEELTHCRYHLIRKRMTEKW